MIYIRRPSIVTLYNNPSYKVSSREEESVISNEEILDTNIDSDDGILSSLGERDSPTPTATDTHAPGHTERSMSPSDGSPSDGYITMLQVSDY